MALDLEILGHSPDGSVPDPRSRAGCCSFCKAPGILPGFGDGRCLVCLTDGLGEEKPQAEYVEPRASREAILDLFLEAQGYGKGGAWSFGSYASGTQDSFQIKDPGQDSRENSAFEIPEHLAEECLRLETIRAHRLQDEARQRQRRLNAERARKQARVEAEHERQRALFRAKRDQERAEIDKARLERRVARSEERERKRAAWVNRPKANPLGLVAGSVCSRLAAALAIGPAPATGLALFVGEHVDDVRNELCRMRKRGLVEKSGTTWTLIERVKETLSAAPTSPPPELRLVSEQSSVSDVPESLCAQYLEKIRWPNGFVCPQCDYAGEPYRFPRRSSVVLCCSACRANISLTAGTVMEKAHLPLSTWFRAAQIVTEGGAALSSTQFQRQLGLRRYASAYDILKKLRANEAETAKLAQFWRKDAVFGRSVRIG